MAGKLEDIGTAMLSQARIDNSVTTCRQEKLPIHCYAFRVRTHIVIAIFYKKGHSLTSNGLWRRSLQLLVQLDLGILNILEKLTVGEPPSGPGMYYCSTMGVVTSNCPEDGQVRECGSHS